MTATAQGLITVAEILRLRRGDEIPTGTLSLSIALSKKPDSPLWIGEAGAIGNTPQQGINWIGQLPRPKAVIVKIVKGRYCADETDFDEANIRYSLKAQKGSVNRLEQANQALLLQPALGYPVIVLVKEAPDTWRCAGQYDASVSAWDNFIVLRRRGRR